LQDLGLGGCGLSKWLDNHLGLPHIVPEVLEMTRSVSKISTTNPKEPMIKDIIWKGFTQTSSKAIIPKLGDS